jgi:DNA mismatch repair protein MutS
MKFDNQTLKDLGIMPSGIDKMSIFEIFNRTATEGGKNKLQDFLITPLDDFNKIIDRQDTFKYIIGDIENWSEYPFKDSLLKAVRKYLSSQIIPTYSVNPLELQLTKLRFKENYFQQVQGILSFREFLCLMQLFFQKHISEDLPNNLNCIFLQLKSFLTNDSIKRFLEVSKKDNISTGNVYKFDHLFRGNLLITIKKILDICYEIDVLVSLSKIIKEREFNFPAFSSSKHPLFKAKGLYHPFLKEPKCYDIDLSKENSFVFLTGPNMAGKTTFLKSCGVSVYLAHLGLAIPAQYLKLSIYNSLVSSINTEDNIKLGYSYFYSEVKRVKSVAQTITSENSAFIILDELFKGTNIHDAYEASKKVIHGFDKWKENHIYLLASHLTELVKDPKTKELLNCKCFDAEIVDGNPVFSFELEEGVSSMRLGLTILEKEKVFEILKI